MASAEQTYSSSNIVQASVEYHVHAQCNTLNELVNIYIVRVFLFTVYTKNVMGF